MRQVQSRSHGLRSPAPGDLVTGLRVVLTLLVGVLLALDAPAVAVAMVLVVALLSDLVDGRVARRTGTASEFGARFDMEADAFLILVLSVAVAAEVGWWVLGLGLARYLFAVVVWSTPALQFTPSSRFWCKVVAAFVAATLAVSAIGLVPTTVEVPFLLVACALLTESFVHEAVDRWRAGARLRTARLEPAGSRA